MHDAADRARRAFERLCPTAPTLSPARREPALAEPAHSPRGTGGSGLLHAEAARLRARAETLGDPGPRVALLVGAAALELMAERRGALAELVQWLEAKKESAP